MRIIFLVIASVAFYSASGATNSKAENYRLPMSIFPVSYTVLLEPDFITDTFDGSIDIDIKVLSSTNFIRLHAHQLNITMENNIQLIDVNEEFISPVSSEFSGDDRHFFTIHFSQNFVVGATYTLRIHQFRGILNLNGEGFYLASYIAENGMKRKLAVTQFQATAARQAFPCFDEPALKALFRIGLIRPYDYITLANTELESTTHLSGNRYLDWHKITHNVMSTYLVAFVVCDYKYVADGTHRVYARPQYINEHRADYALSKSKPMLNGIERFTGIPYSWPKMDQIGIPDEYFWAGAMENWGLVTYRETLLLYATGITTSMTKQHIILIIGHEYGHKWFGNLVSPLWWEYLWLNEGFATYFEYYGPSVQDVEPGMEMMTQFSLRATQTALQQDSSTNTTPMRRQVNTPEEVESMFNFVIYPKAAAVIKMMEDVLTTPVFRYGEYSVAEPSDLYNSWQQGIVGTGINYLPVNETVASIMLTWELNAGYPLVTVSRDYASGTVLLQQRRFIDSNPHNNDPSLWSIPITYSTSSHLNFAHTVPDTWLLSREESKSFAFLSVSDWLILNNKQSGYYRVNYDTTNWYLIINYLNFGPFDSINRINRAQLIDDSFSLARFGVLDYSIALDLSLYLTREINFIPLFPYMNAISFLDIFLQNSNIHHQYLLYIQRVFNLVYTTVGLTENDNDGHLIKLTRQNVLHWICRYGDLSCRFHSLTAIRAWKNNNVLVPPNMQTVYACSALRVGNQEDFNFIFNMYASEELQIRQRLLAALGCTEKVDILNNYMKIILSENSTVLEADRLTALAGIHGAGAVGLDYFYNYFKENYAVFRDRFSNNQFTSIVNSLATRFTTMSQLEDFRALASLSDSEELFKNALNTATSNVQWSEKNVQVIGEWLASKRF